MLKKLHTSLVIMLVTFPVLLQAQDIITLRNGVEMIVKVVEVNDQVVRFRNFNKPDGPVMEEFRGNVNLITYENGDKKVYSKKGVKDISSFVPKSTVKLELLSIVFNSIALAYEHPLNDRMSVEVKAGMIGIGIPTVGNSYENDFGSRYTEWRNTKDRDQGFFVRVGPKFMNKRIRFFGRGYIKPELVYSQKEFDGAEFSARLDPEYEVGVDYTYSAIQRSVGALLNFGYDFFLGDLFTLDVNVGAGLSIQTVNADFEGMTPYENFFPYQVYEDEYFKYTHIQSNGISLSAGIAFGMFLE